jgi:hypothetical protein
MDPPGALELIMRSMAERVPREELNWLNVKVVPVARTFSVAL